MSPLRRIHGTHGQKVRATRNTVRQPRGLTISKQEVARPFHQPSLHALRRSLLFMSAHYFLFSNVLFSFRVSAFHSLPFLEMLETSRVTECVCEREAALALHVIGLDELWQQRAHPQRVLKGREGRGSTTRNYYWLNWQLINLKSIWPWDLRWTAAPGRLDGVLSLAWSTAPTPDEALLCLCVHVWHMAPYLPMPVYFAEFVI